MMFWCRQFNSYLLILSLALCWGCQTGGKSKEEKEKDKEATILRLHLEVNPDGTERNGPVNILRDPPITLNVTRDPFLRELDIEEALVLEVMGVPGIQLRFKFPHAVRLLEAVTTSYKGQRIAVFCQFPEARWLAAPQITQRIADGVFTFTPDASKAECDRIVRGLNNVAKELKKKS